MKSACRAKQPTPTPGCHGSKWASSSRTTLPDTVPRRYAVTYSDFIWTSQIYGANRIIVMMIRFHCLLSHSCCFAALSIIRISVIALRNLDSRIEFEAILVKSSLPLKLMRPPRRSPRATERRSFESCPTARLPDESSTYPPAFIKFHELSPPYAGAEGLEQSDSTQFIMQP